MGPSDVSIGIDIGQKVDPTAIAICEAEEIVTIGEGWSMPSRAGLVEPRDIKRTIDRRETHYTARHIERLPLGTPYPEVAAHITKLVAGLHRRGVYNPLLIVDATGVGLPVIDILLDALKGYSVRMVAATFTHGDRYIRERSTASVGKAHLVSRLQVLLQTGCVHLPKTSEADMLARELQDYEIKVDQDANDRYGAFKVGAHDDLVTALGLAVLDDPIVDRRKGMVYSWS